MKFISRCDWVIFFGRVSIYFWTIICCLRLFLLFRVFPRGYQPFILRLVTFWLIFWKVTNCLKSLWSSTKLSSLWLFILLLMSSSILTSIIFGVPLISVSLFIWCFRLLISLIYSADFLFVAENSVCIFLIFVPKSLALFMLLVFSACKLLLFQIFYQLKRWFSSLNTGFIRSGKRKGKVSFLVESKKVRESQGIHNVVKENRSIFRTLLREKRIVTQ